MGFWLVVGAGTDDAVRSSDASMVCNLLIEISPDGFSYANETDLAVLALKILTIRYPLKIFLLANNQYCVGNNVH